MQIQISWLLQKPTDLDLLCLQGGAYLGSTGPGLIIILPSSRYDSVKKDVKCQIIVKKTLMTSCLAILHTKPLLKGICCKRKEFAGSNFFPFRVDPFSGDEQNFVSVPL